MKTLEEFGAMVREKYKEQRRAAKTKNWFTFEYWLIREMYGMYKELEGYREIAESIPTEP